MTNFLLVIDLSDGTAIIQILLLAFLAILFLQSGLDKVFNYKANLEWLNEHFSKSPLKNMVGLMMPAITFLEVSAGAMSLIGIFTLFFLEDMEFGFIGALFSAVAVLALFFGQRLAQQYEGAATLTTYFMISLAAIYFLR